ncbi:MAG TPA: methionyl-tRNA formyltransferase [Planctomycetota bacterium]|nr:methionyl-tRNA formyltransferase [Planctomycetota bacterium]HRR78741.1 methionyl-tRNA formyltransferase [Planctomycetota bacterium]HRT95624.1 methionyl-tRNA formyltransferase [Planctomycetota bacterium]
MRIAFLGTPDFAVPSLEALLGAGHEIVCVATQPDRPSGRHALLTAPPVKRVALAYGLPVLQTANVNERAFVAALAERAPEAIVVAAFGQKLRRRVLALPRLGCLNVHASLLPRHRGAAPVAHAILAGDAETGVTIMRMNERVDAGDILAQEATPIGPRETTGDLTARLASLGAGLLVRTLSAIAAGTAHPIPQDPSLATRAPALDKADGVIPWDRPAAYLARFVRAMAPWPGAFTFMRRPGKPPLRLVVHEAEPLEGPAAPPGEVAIAEGDCLVVGTGHALLRLLTLQPAGGRTMSASDFLRGHRVAVGDRFGKPD